MDRVISIGEIHRISRLMIKYKKRMSAWPLLILIELSQHDDFYSLNKIVKSVDDKGEQIKTQYTHLYQPLIDLGLVEIKKVAGLGSQFPSLLIKLKPHIHVIDSDDFDYPLILRLFNICRSYMAENRKTSPLLMLVLIAIKVRKIDATDLLKAFCKVNAQIGNSSHVNILNGLEKLGVISMVKAGSHRSAPVLIFEVESCI